MFKCYINVYTLALAAFTSVLTCKGAEAVTSCEHPWIQQLSKSVATSLLPLCGMDGQGNIFKEPP